MCVPYLRLEKGSLHIDCGRNFLPWLYFRGRIEIVQGLPLTIGINANHYDVFFEFLAEVLNSFSHLFVLVFNFARHHIICAHMVAAQGATDEDEFS